jgi:hypothetical protein
MRTVQGIFDAAVFNDFPRISWILGPVFAVVPGRRSSRAPQIEASISMKVFILRPSTG